MMIQSTYRTSDTALAAFLTLQGFHATIEWISNSKAVFIFDQASKLEKYVVQFDTARAVGNIVLFFNAYQNLLRRINERY